MKKLFALLVCVLLVFALISCGDDSCSHRDADDNSLCDKCGESYTDGKDLPDEHTHDYNVKNTDSKYLDKAADCENAATYFYSCSCGEKGTTTFTHGDANGHSYTVKNTDSKYLDKAADCENAAIYFYSCSCGEKGTTTFTHGDANGHSYTVKNTDSKYLDKAADCENAATYFYSCSCEDKGADVFIHGDKLGHLEHSYEAKEPTCTTVGWYAYVACDRTGCGYTTKIEREKLDHEYSEELKYNATHHYHECKCGAKSGEAEHVSSGSASATNDEVCTECGYVINVAIGISFKTLTVTGNNVYGKVSSDTEQYSFIDEVKVSGGAKYIVSTNVTGTGQIPAKTIDLTIGDNTVYVIEMIDDEPSQVYTVVIRRRPVYEVRFNTAGGTTVETQYVEEDSFATEPTTTRAGYTFTGWDYDFSASITSDIHITASWKANTDTKYTVEYYLENLEKTGYDLAETENLEGTTDTTVVITPKAFEHFTYNAQKSATSGTVYADGSLVLRVYYTRNSYTVTTSIDNTNGGSVTKGKAYPYGTEVKLNTVVNAGYTFIGYFIGNEKLYDKADYTFTVSENLNIVAKVIANKNTAYKVEYYLENLNDNGYTLAETENLNGTTDTTANAAIKTFEHFTYNAQKSIMSGTVAGDGSLVLKLYYARNSYTVTTSMNNTKGGSVTKGNTYPYGTEIKLSTVVNSGYTFIGYFVGSDKICDIMEYTLNVSENLNIVANVKANENTAYKVEYYLENLNDNGYTLAETENLNGTTDTTANAAIKTFEHFTYNPSKGTASGNVDGSGTLVLRVYYTIDRFSLANENTSFGSITGGGTHKYGSNVTATATPKPGYIFVGWYSGDRLLSSSITYEFVIDCNITAKFMLDPALAPFYYTLSDNSCIITGLKDETVTEIIIPNSVTSIGWFAFRYCTSLTSVVIGDSVTSIGDSAFYDCDSLTSVTIGNSVTSIGNRAFEDCTSLTSVVIPDSVTSIGDYAFSGCYRLVEIVNNSSLNITAGSYDYGQVAYYAKDVHKGEIKGVTNVDGYLFYTSSNGVHYFVGYIGNDTELTLPDSYNGENYVINDYAFYHCYSFTSVTIGNSVKSIGDYAFSYCDSLTSVVIPDSVTSIGNSAFWNCTSLTSVTIGNSVTSIGDYAFSYCDSLTSITIGNSVTDIGVMAFYYCDSLNAVYITDIASWCNIKFRNYVANPLCYAKNLYLNGELVTELVIPDSVTSIRSYAFYGCDSLTSVVIGNNVTSIGDYAFYSCDSLTSITIGNNVTSIGDYAFYDCRSLMSIKYRGTSSQWNTIYKGSRWNEYNLNGSDYGINYTITYNYEGE